MGSGYYYHYHDCYCDYHGYHDNCCCSSHCCYYDYAQYHYYFGSCHFCCCGCCHYYCYYFDLIGDFISIVPIVPIIIMIFWFRLLLLRSLGLFWFRLELIFFSNSSRSSWNDDTSWMLLFITWALRTSVLCHCGTERVIMLTISMSLKRVFSGLCCMVSINWVAWFVSYSREWTSCLSFCWTNYL